MTSYSKASVEAWEAMPKVAPGPTPDEILADIITEWPADARRLEWLMAQPIARLSDDDLSLRHAVNERWLLACSKAPAADAFGDSQREIDRRAAKAGL